MGEADTAGGENFIRNPYKIANNSITYRSQYE